jgi:alkylhydroperoxidase/carboxymuconolactone decarboxylase family protein YurZ
MSENANTLHHLSNRIADERQSMEDVLLKHSSVYPVLVEQMSRIYGEGKTEGGLDQVHKILIALAMAVKSGSESAVEWTITRAVNHGATDQMIRDAIDVALLNGGTFTVSNARLAFSASTLRRAVARKSKIQFTKPGELKPGSR